ncbi:aminotransferase class V-fold PLP-dependent enzyme [Mucilaginibacter sp. HD30]
MTKAEVNGKPLIYMLPVKAICRLAATKGIPVLLDGTQAAPHMPVDMQDVGCVFMCFLHIK